MKRSTTVGAFLLDICQQVSSPVSDAVKRHVGKQEWDELASMRVDPGHYHDSETYWADAQLVDLFRKFEDLPTTFDRKAKALDNFWASEKKCCRTNLRLIPFLNPVDYPVDSYGEDVIRRILSRARKIVSRILGKAPHQSASFEGYQGSFGPGATYGDKGKLVTVPDKMMSHPTLTAGAIQILFEWSETAWARACTSAGRKPQFVPGNRFTTVPKDCVKDRGIAIEPSLNVFYQLALGRVMKRRLKRAGVNLQVSQPIHQQVAREASVTGGKATIDLSNASDTVAYNLVKLLLPHAWFEILTALRSPRTLVNDQWILLEKFSSMGNGFTFELETLIFLALSCAAVDECNSEKGPSRPAVPGCDVYVFGDDIIVPTESSSEVIAVLRYFGFDPNKQKTFVEGPFRESCGGDFFSGMAVRPFQQKGELSEPQHYIAFANGLRRACNGLDSRWRVVRGAWFRALEHLPVHIRSLRGPEGLGDLVIHDDNPANWKFEYGDPHARHAGHRDDGVRRIRCYAPIERWVSWKHFTPYAQHASALYGVGDGELGVQPRGDVAGYVETWIPYPWDAYTPETVQWDSFGHRKVVEVFSDSTREWWATLEDRVQALVQGSRLIGGSHA